MSVIEMIPPLDLRVLVLLVFGGFIMHVHFISSRPWVATFSFVAVSALILAVFGAVIMVISSI